MVFNLLPDIFANGTPFLREIQEEAQNLKKKTHVRNSAR